MKRLGGSWFEKGATEEVDALLIHEFAHQFSGDHLSHEYHTALCMLGARLKRLALDKPDALSYFTPAVHEGRLDLRASDTELMGTM